MEHKRPFFKDVVEGKPFVFTFAEDQVGIQYQLLTMFLKNGGQFWVLEDFWTQVGMLTDSAASISDFNGSY